MELKANLMRALIFIAACFSATAGAVDTAGSATAGASEAMSARAAAISEGADAIADKCDTPSVRGDRDLLDVCLTTAMGAIPSGLQSEIADEVVRRGDLKRREEFAAACRKKRIPLGTVAIGMSDRDVMKCGWGTPERVSRTTTAKHVVEWWSYKRASLVFDNGVLREIHD